MNRGQTTALRDQRSAYARHDSQPEGSGEFETDEPLSTPPSSFEAKQVELATQVARDLARVRVLRAVGRLLLFGGLPLFLVVLLGRHDGRIPRLGLLLEGLSLVLATASCLSPMLSLGARRWFTSLSLTGLALGSLLHFGPLLGSGLLFVAAQLIASLLLGRRGGMLITLVLVTAVVTTGLAVTSTPAEAGSPLVGLGLQRNDWLRLAATTALGLAGIATIFDRMQADQWRTFEKEVASRVRERRLVAEREKVVRRAANFQRLESLGRLAGGIAHDFNNALVVLQCGIEVLGDKAISTAERLEITSELEGAVERAGLTARQLLSFAKRNVEEIGQCSPEAVLTQLRKESTRLVPAHIQLRMEIKSCPQVAISAPALEQSVLNLVQNARDALGDRQGQVLVLLETDPDTGGMHLCVSDDGPGMPPAVADQAFEPFFTTKGDHGAGLGLSTVWGMIRRHGGEVALDTTPEEGTRVHLYLPSNIDEDHSSSSIALVAATSVTEIARILILEDERPVRSALRRIFVNLGFEVTETGTVEEAREACRGQSFSLLLSDGVVPDGGVGAFIQEFSRQYRRAPVILCSGYLEEDLALEGIAKGKCSFLAKPFTVSELTLLVREILPLHFAESSPPPP